MKAIASKMLLMLNICGIPVTNEEYLHAAILQKKFCTQNNFWPSNEFNQSRSF
jgi:hypothetical protein